MTIAVFLPDGPAARVCTEIAQRQSMRPRTYSVTAPWTHRQRLQRAKEAMMDQVVDWQREIEALDAEDASRG